MFVPNSINVCLLLFLYLLTQNHRCSTHTVIATIPQICLFYAYLPMQTHYTLKKKKKISLFFFFFLFLSGTRGGHIRLFLKLSFFLCIYRPHHYYNIYLACIQHQVCRILLKTQSLTQTSPRPYFMRFFCITYIFIVPQHSRIIS